MNELIDLFLEHAPPVLQSVRLAVSNGNSTELRAQAHRLKVFCANLGANRLITHCADLEKRGLEGRLEGAAELLSRCEIEFIAVTSDLTKKWKRAG